MKKSLSILLLIFVMIVVLRLAGFTYGYYAANIHNNTGSHSVSVISKNLSVEYLDGTSIMNFDGDYLFPGDSAEKTFTVKNTGEFKATYNVLIDNVLNEFERTQDLRYVLYINDEEVTSGAINNNSIQYLYSNKEINSGATDSVRFVFEYATTDEIQNVDMNKTISFRFNIDSNIVGLSEGTTVNLLANQNINNYRIYGNSIQNGTPTPSTPIEIESVGDKTKNLWSLGDKTFTQYKEYSLLEPLEPGTYTISCTINSADTDSNSRLIVLIHEDDTQFALYGLYDGDNNVKTFTLSKTVNKVRMYAADTWINASGDSVTFSNIQIEKGSSASAYEPYGKYKIPVKVSGKNLFNINESFSASRCSINANNTSLVITPNVTTGTVFATYKINLKPNTKYTISYNSKLLNPSDYPDDGASPGIWVRTESNGGTVIKRSTNTISDIEEYTTFTFDSGSYETVYLWIYYNSMGSSGISKNPNAQWIVSNLQIEEGSLATNYEPYVESVTTNIYLDEPLRKIGDYADYIDFSKQVVVRQIKELQFTGNENINVFSSNPYPYSYYVLGEDGLVVNDKGLSNYFVSQSNFSYQILGDNVFRVYNSNSNLQSRIGFRLVNNGAIISNVSDVKSILLNAYNNGNPLTFNYVSADAIETPIKLPLIKTDTGLNIVEVSTTIAPSSIDLEYYN